MVGIQCHRQTVLDISEAKIEMPLFAKADFLANLNMLSLQTCDDSKSL